MSSKATDSSLRPPQGFLERLAARIPKFIKKNPHLRLLVKTMYGACFYRLLNLFPEKIGDRRDRGQVIFADVSSIAALDHHTGIQRVTKNLYKALASRAVLVPVYASVRKKGWFLAKAVESEGELAFSKTPEKMRAASGDIFLALDFSPASILAQLSGLRAMRAKNMRLFFIVHDLIPVLSREFFPAGSAPLHSSWLLEASRLGGMICVSRTVAGELREWLAERGETGPDIYWFHHGFDGANFHKSRLRHENVLLPSLPYFLVVSTIEPRKGHAETLAAFTELWRDGKKVSLVLVGKKGWKVDDLCQKITSHPQYGKMLFWHDHCGDGELGQLYAHAMCVLMPSHAEGFGLALIEGAAFGKPLLLRDLPVFREVAGENAFYFSGGAREMATAIAQWLELYARSSQPAGKIAVQPWSESAETVLRIMGKCD